MKYPILSKNLKKFRKNAHLTQKELGEKIYKSEISIRKYESGNSNIPLSTLFDICTELNVSIVELLGSDLDKYYNDNNVSEKSIRDIGINKAQKAINHAKNALNEADNIINKNNIKLIGEQIKIFRRALQMTQEQLSEKVNIPLNLLQKIELGEKLPDNNTLFKIANTLHVPMGAITGDNKITTSYFIKRLSKSISTATKQYLEKILSSGATIDQLSNDTKIPVNKLKSLLNNSDNMTVDETRLLAKYLKLDNNQLAEWMASDMYTALNKELSILNLSDNDYKYLYKRILKSVEKEVENINYHLDDSELKSFELFMQFLDSLGYQDVQSYGNVYKLFHKTKVQIEKEILYLKNLRNKTVHDKQRK